MIWRGRLLTRRFGNTWQTYNPVTNDWVNLYTSGYFDFDNNGGGGWYKYINIPITTTPSEYAQYKIVIDPTNVTVYAADGTQEAQGAVASDFWDNVQSDGDDIRVFDQAKDQLYFWIESWDYSGQNAVIWVKLPAGSTELNIAYGNPSALKSSYEDGELVFEFFDDFETDTIASGKWQVVTGEWTIETENSLIWNDDNQLARIKSQFNDVGNFIYELNTRHDEADTTSWAGIQIKSPSTDYDTYDQGYLILHYGNDGRTRIFRADSGSLTELAYNIIEIPQGEWFVLKVIYTDGTIKAYINDELITQATDNTYQSGEVIRIWNNNLAQKTSYDWIRIYKLADPADFGTPQILEF